MRTLPLFALGLIAQAIVGVADGLALPLVPDCEAEAFCVDATVGRSRQQVRVTSSSTYTALGEYTLFVNVDGEYEALDVTFSLEPALINPAVPAYLGVTPSNGCTVAPTAITCRFAGSGGTVTRRQQLRVDVLASQAGSAIHFVEISADNGPPLESRVMITSQNGPPASRPFFVTLDVPIATQGPYSGLLSMEFQTPVRELEGQGILKTIPEDSPPCPAPPRPCAAYGLVTLTATPGNNGVLRLDNDMLPTNFGIAFSQTPTGTATDVDLAFNVTTPILVSHTNTFLIEVDGGGPLSVQAPTAVVSNMVTIRATDPTATEAGRTTGTFTVTRNGSVAAPLTVFYMVAGTAARVSDYAALPGSVTIPAGQPSARITVTPTDDTQMEGPETVVLTLVPRPTYVVGAPGRATVNITSNEVVTVVATDATATEAGRTTGTFTVRRNGSVAAPLTVFYTVSGTATRVSDYAALRGSLTIPAGQLSAAIRVTPIDDVLMEGTETVVLTLAPRPTYTVGTPSSARVNITSNEVVTVVATDPTATEAGRTTGTFTVRRTGSAATPLIVFYTVAGTATRVSDYAALPSSVTIPAGQLSAPIIVRPIDDVLMEGPETVILTLAPRPTYTIGTPSRATVNITSNEVVTVVATDPTATEAGRTTGTFTVRRTGNAIAPLIVFYAVAGTATPGSDYATLPGSVTIPAGVLSAPIIVRPIDDTQVEGIQTVVLALVPRPTSYTLGPPSIATVNITSNE